jgi:hypothetical protein
MNNTILSIIVGDGDLFILGFLFSQLCGKQACVHVG